MTETEDPNFITALARGLSVIRAFGRDYPKMTLADVAQRTDLPRATVRRSLLTLKALGYVDSDGKYFSLSPNILCLGYAYLSATPLPGLIQPSLDLVSEQTGASCSASVFNGTDVVYIARSAKRRILSLDLGVGSTLPAFCTSMGRVLLAELPADQLDAYFTTVPRTQPTPRTIVDAPALRDILAQTRRQGWAAVDQELELGLWSLAVPIRNAGGIAVAAMNISLPATQAGDYETTERLVQILRTAAAQITAILPG